MIDKLGREPAGRGSTTTPPARERGASTCRTPGQQTPPPSPRTGGVPYSPSAAQRQPLSPSGTIFTSPGPSQEHPRLSCPDTHLADAVRPPRPATPRARRAARTGPAALPPSAAPGCPSAAEAAGTRRLWLEHSACVQTGGRRGRGAPPPSSSSSRSAGSSRALPVCRAGSRRRPPARPAVPPPARSAVSHWPQPAGPPGPRPAIGRGRRPSRRPRGSGRSRCAVPRPLGARESGGSGRGVGSLPGGVGCGRRLYLIWTLQSSGRAFALLKKLKNKKKS